MSFMEGEMRLDTQPPAFDVLTDAGGLDNKGPLPHALAS